MNSILFLVIVGIILFVFVIVMFMAVLHSPVKRCRRSSTKTAKFPINRIHETQLRDYGWRSIPEYKLYKVTITSKFSKKRIILWEAPDFVTLNKFLYANLSADSKFLIEPISNWVKQ